MKFLTDRTDYVTLYLKTIYMHFDCFQDKTQTVLLQISHLRRFLGNWASRLRDHDTEQGKSCQGRYTHLSSYVYLPSVLSLPFSFTYRKENIFNVIALKIYRELIRFLKAFSHLLRNVIFIILCEVYLFIHFTDEKAAAKWFQVNHPGPLS